MLNVDVCFNMDMHVGYGNSEYIYKFVEPPLRQAEFVFFATTEPY